MPDVIVESYKKWEDDSMYIWIDGEYYPITILEMKRKADILDKTAYRDEAGQLHREVIGTFYNYSLKMGIIVDTNLQKARSAQQKITYDKLFKKLSEPVASHKVMFPHDHEKYDAYFSSVQDDIIMITEDGYRAKGLSCNCTGMKPRVKPSDIKKG